VIRPERPAWELSVQKAGNKVLAVTFAAAAALIVWKLSIWRVIGPIFGFVFYLVTFVVLTVVFYFFLEWLFMNRPDEIARKVPTSSKELGRKKKRYFGNLPK
jgi:hypothetical protein